MSSIRSSDRLAIKSINRQIKEMDAIIHLVAFFTVKMIDRRVFINVCKQLSEKLFELNARFPTHIKYIMEETLRIQNKKESEFRNNIKN